MSGKEEFIEIFREKITRPGADALLDYLENKSDFFTAPASARYHGAYAGGLCDHSLNVYHCLVDYLARQAGIAMEPGELHAQAMTWSTVRRVWQWWPCSMICARWAAIKRAFGT